MKRIVFLGAPGAGKGLVAGELAKAYKIPAISPGRMLRELAETTKYGRKLRDKYWSKGDLVPHKDIMALVRKRLRQKDCAKGFILDGFPRQLRQAKDLLKLTALDYVFYFKVSEKTSIRRVMGRLQCKTCGAIYHIELLPPRKEGVCDEDKGELYIREDDNDLAAVKERLAVFNKETEPVLSFFEAEHLLIEIDAEQGQDKILQALRYAMES